MPKVKEKQTREGKLKNKRESERNRYLKIKNDPAAYEKQKEKESKKYVKKKMKSIGNKAHCRNVCQGEEM